MRHRLLHHPTAAPHRAHQTPIGVRLADSCGSSCAAGTSWRDLRSENRATDGRSTTPSWHYIAFSAEPPPNATPCSTKTRRSRHRGPKSRSKLQEKNLSTAKLRKLGEPLMRPARADTIRSAIAVAKSPLFQLHMPSTSKMPDRYWSAPSRTKKPAFQALQSPMSGVLKLAPMGSVGHSVARHDHDRATGVARPQRRVLDEIGVCPDGRYRCGPELPIHGSCGTASRFGANGCIRATPPRAWWA